MIVAMKKAQLVVLKEDEDCLLKSLQKYGVLMLIKTSDDHDYQTSDGQAQTRIENLIKNLVQYREDEKMKDLVVNYDEFVQDDPKRQEYLEEIEKTKDAINHLEQLNQTLNEELKTLLPWKDLDWKLSDLTSFKLAKVHTGFIEPRKFIEFEQVINAYGGTLKTIGYRNNVQSVLFAVYYQDDEALLNEVKNLGFEEYFLPKEDALVKDLILEKKAKIDANKQEIINLEAILKNLANRIDELMLLNDQISSQKELDQARSVNLITKETCYVEGWVRSDQKDLLEKAIQEATDIYDLVITEPGLEETPPTVTKNSKFTAPFETITDMFSKPNPYELDPNPIMSFWYWILFGIMMGDAGYGLVMMVAAHLFIKYKKPKGGTLRIIKIFYYSGITTILWGIVFGSYFGFSWDPLHALGVLISKPGWKSVLLQPMDNPIQMLVVSLVLGAFHIITGIIMKAIRNYKDKQYIDLFADQVSWLLILIGIGLAVLPQTSKIGVPMAIIGAVIVVLTAGRSKKNIFSRLVSGVLSLYNISGYLSDILSYSRILALALSTAVIGMVMNMLAGMVMSVPVVGVVIAAIVFLIGHVFNIGMGLLSAYVHDSRLQYVEFFGKFYDGGGYEFKPLSLKLKYVNQVKTQENEKNNKERKLIEEVY